MIWYVLGMIVSIAVFFFGNSIGMSAVVKWIVIGLIWAASAHMDMKSKTSEKKETK